jgi:hypothetical protein
MARQGMPDGIFSNPNTNLGKFRIGIFDGHLLYFTAIGYILWNLWLFRIFFPVLVCSTKRNLATLGTAPIARISSEVFPFKTIRSQSFALIFFFDNYFTQIHTITMQRTALQCTYGILKSLHPGKIRTHDLLFRCRRRCPLHHTTPPRQSCCSTVITETVPHIITRTPNPIPKSVYVCMYLDLHSLLTTTKTLSP